MIVTGIVVGALILTGDVRLTWTFSAFNVLFYYALTNAAAMRLPANLRFLPRWLAVAGLVSCLVLVVFIDLGVWLIGVGLLVFGVIWHRVAVSRRG